jgi:hypothetical protein
MNGELRETDLSDCCLNMSVEGTEEETRPISSNCPQLIITGSLILLEKFQVQGTGQ